MNVGSCKICKRLFQAVVPDEELCPRCKGMLEVKLQETTQYIAEHCEADIDEVAVKCEVEPDQIRKWIEEKKMRTPAESKVGVPCESCGILVHYGKLCDKCNIDRYSVINNLSKAFDGK